MKWGYGSKPRCRHSSVVAVAEETEGIIDEVFGLKSYWNNLPSELLREVLIRIEDAESKWPLRKNVVACAGVCRSWRDIMKELVKTPEVSGKLTFPISVKQPGPRDTLLQCFIKRNQATQTYHLYLSVTQALADDGKFLLAARKYRRPTCTVYIISLDADEMSKGGGTCIGKLRSNFLGTKFTIYDSVLPYAGAKLVKSRSTRLVGSKQMNPRVPSGNYEVAHISYELNVLGTSRGPRKMHCVMDAIPASAIKPGGIAPTQVEFPMGNNSGSSLPTRFLRSKSNRSLSGPIETQKEGSLVLKNKAPRWHEQLQCWCLNFHGRVTVASVKNFQLVASPENGVVAGPEHEKVILQFGKVGKDMFTMDYRYPLSAFQAFTICLSSFDTKIACE
ncbi:hypothetical protein RND71_001837 [Anisodus tanguticus]|uniref:Tubby-like F-box protein n=1 Tax=Anisodus tanguticus TaxID=243964 RepID=A0AAE1VYP7_9SOLA|nr:hypothetical protein RND71_001837 [Anisodus tanguticus]